MIILAKWSVYGPLEFVVLIVALAIYFIPTIIGRKNNNNGTVFLINFFFGWTIVGWIIALIKAIADREPTVLIRKSNEEKYDELKKLEDLRSKGRISAKKFMAEKIKILKS